MNLPLSALSASSRAFLPNRLPFSSALHTQSDTSRSFRHPFSFPPWPGRACCVAPKNDVQALSSFGQLSVRQISFLFCGALIAALCVTPGESMPFVAMHKTISSLLSFLSLFLFLHDHEHSPLLFGFLLHSHILTSPVNVVCRESNGRVLHRSTLSSFQASFSAPQFSRLHFLSVCLRASSLQAHHERLWWNL